jgi:hypothetical protein
MNLKERLALYERLVIGLSKGVAIEATLRAQGLDAGEVAARNDALGERLAAVRRTLHERWRGRADRLLRKIRRINAKLQAARRDIERGVEVARRIARAVGHLDDAAALAGGLV